MKPNSPLEKMDKQKKKKKKWTKDTSRGRVAYENQTANTYIKMLNHINKS